VVPRDASPAGHAIATGQPVIARGSELDRFDTEVIRILRAEGLQAVCCIPLIHHAHTFGTLNLASRRLDSFTPEDVELLQPSPRRLPSLWKTLWPSRKSRLSK